MWLWVVCEVTNPVPYSVTAVWGWSAPSAPPVAAPSTTETPSNPEPCSRFESTRDWVAPPLATDSWKVTAA